MTILFRLFDLSFFNFLRERASSEKIARSSHFPFFATGILLLILSVASMPMSLRAQEREAEPLQKTDVVEMLTFGLYSQTEIAETIQLNCLTFTPTDRDYRDFRRLGASETVIEAIRSCAESPGDQTETEEPSAGPSPVDLLVQDTLVRATAGDTFEVRAQLLRQRDGAPAAGARMRLRQVVRGTADAVTLAEERAGEDGRVRFRAPAPISAGAYVLGFDAPGRPIAGTPSARLRVLPGSPTLAALDPALVELNRVNADTVRLTVRLSDPYGNPVPETEVRLVTPSGGATAGVGITDADGRAVVSVTRNRARGAGFLNLQAAGRQIASLPVVGAEEAAAGAPEATEEVAETESRSVPDSLAFLLAAATRAEEENATDRAERLYRAAVELDPRDADALLGAARAHLRKGDYAEAIRHYQRVVDVDSTRFEARLGIGHAALEADMPELAVHWYETAAEQAPDSVSAWTGLVRAYRAAGDEQGEIRALREALELAPDREDLQGRLAALRPSPSPVRARLTLWGGNGFSNANFDPGSGFQRASAEIWPEPGVVGLYLEYDREGIEPERPGLIRGGAGFESWHGGIRVKWGSDRLLSTRIEAGVREQPPADIQQRLVRVEQILHFGDGSRSEFQRPAVRVAGTVGSWEGDREDDYFLRAGAALPVTPTFRVSSDIQYGKAHGTWSSTESAVRLTQQREFRFWLTPTYRSPGGWETKVSLAYGQVENPGLSSWDTLLEGSVRASVPLREVGGPSLHDLGELVFFYRYQAPGINRHFAFQVLSVGVSLTLPE